MAISTSLLDLLKADTAKAHSTEAVLFGPFFSKLASKAEPYSSFRNLYCNDMHMEEGSLSSISSTFLPLHKSNAPKQRKGVSGSGRGREGWTPVKLISRDQLVTYGTQGCLLIELARGERTYGPT